MDSAFIKQPNLTSIVILVDYRRRDNDDKLLQRSVVSLSHKHQSLINAIYRYAPALKTSCLPTRCSSHLGMRAHQYLE
jgi:hypothetical protein